MREREGGREDKGRGREGGRGGREGGRVSNVESCTVNDDSLKSHAW